MGPWDVSRLWKPDHLIMSLSLSLYSIKCLLKWRLVFWVSVTTIQRVLVRLADPSESLGTFDIKPCQLAGVFTQDPHRKRRGGEKERRRVPLFAHAWRVAISLVE